MERGSAGNSGDATVDADLMAAQERVRADLFKWTAARIGRYSVLERIGSGGMAVVYAAYDTELDRKVALKVLRSGASSTTRDRLRAEARALAKLQHANVVQVFEVIEHEGDLALAMEFVQGEDLQAYFSRAPGWRDVARVMTQAGQGLAAAHAQGLVHRDFKPHNVLLDEQGRARVADFGLARLASAAAEDSGSGHERSLSSASDLTRSGALLGTPAYMAPELFDGQPATVHSDQFAFCVTLYRGLYRRLPFRGMTVAELAAAIDEGEPALPPDTDVPARLRAVTLRGLSRRAEDRFASMAELCGALQAATRRRRVALPVLGAASALGLGALAFAAREEAPVCAEASASVRDVFDGESRRSAHDAILAADPVLGAELWATVETSLDAYAAELAQQRVEACRATRVLGTQSEDLLDRRIACVDRRAQRARALIRAMAQVDRDGARLAPRGAASLAPVSDCADAASLAGDVDVPPPSLAAEVQSAREELAELEALYSFGGSSPERMQALNDAVADIAYAPLHAEVELESAFHLVRSGAVESGRAAAESSFWIAVEARSDAIALSVAIKLVAVASQRSMYADGDAWGRVAEVFVRRRGNRPYDVGRLYSVRGGLLRKQRKFDEAEAALARATSALVAAGAPPVATSECYREYAAVAVQQGAYAEGKTRALEALRLAREGYSPRHPEVGLALGALAAAQRRLGELDEAFAAFEEAASIARAAFGPDSRRVLTTEENLALVAADIDPARGVARLAALLPRARDTLGEDTLDYADTLSNYAAMLSRAGRDDEALEATAAVVPIVGRTAGTQGNGYARALHNLGAAYGALGRHDAALPYLEQALALFEATLGPAHPNVSLSLRANAISLSGLGRHDEALAAWERALAILEQSEAAAAVRCEAQREHADSLAAAGRPTRAAEARAAATASCELAEQAQRAASP